MDNFDVISVNDVLWLVIGVQVDEWEINCISYSVCGFDIFNMQIDGIGLFNNWGIFIGVMDSFGYEKVEVICGVNGLFIGVGNVVGIINYVCKCLINQCQGVLGVSYGLWGIICV